MYVYKFSCIFVKIWISNQSIRAKNNYVVNISILLGYILLRISIHQSILRQDILDLMRFVLP